MSCANVRDLLNLSQFHNMYGGESKLIKFTGENIDQTIDNINNMFIYGQKYRENRLKINEI